MRSEWIDPLVRRILPFCAVVCILAAGAARAQDVPPPAHLAVVDGSATLVRDGDTQRAEVDLPFLPGDRLSTEAGRVEVLFPDGAALDLDQFSVIDLEAPSRLRLQSGRAILVVPDDAGAGLSARYEIVTPLKSVLTSGSGVYRVDAAAGAVMARGDAFDRWSDAQRSERTEATRSSAYLPPDLESYGSTFDEYGSWQFEDAYGYVWYPAVAPGWRPYFYGSWVALPAYGWTWVGLDRWSWPTHHYGRWGYGRDRWFWIPGRTWSAAWVSWAVAPGYVSWCPLGFDNRPVFSMSIGYGNPWPGWTVVPRDRFAGRGWAVYRHAVDPRHLGPDTPFIVQRTPPVAISGTSRVAPGAGAGVRTGAGRSAPRAGVGPDRLPGVAVPRPGTSVRPSPSPGVTVPRRAVPRTMTPVPAPGATAPSYGTPARPYGAPGPDGATPRPYTVPRPPDQSVGGAAAPAPPRAGPGTSPAAGSTPHAAPRAAPAPPAPSEPRGMAVPRAAPAPSGPPAARPGPGGTAPHAGGRGGAGGGAAGRSATGGSTSRRSR